MERTVQQTGAKSVRESMIAAMEFIESLPLMRPRWVAVDVLVIVLLLLH